ncbi:hypothetical protein CEXT_307441 [Caerostris extrusa]|uniref:Uncharacterized protein n=1 Tax=Caerostris extrusa TaxID=172846 RepID=A0AAV4XB52_CAEEX|nr:hypothetical protein CEXT_307441 [Caerostris extrusa]
MPPNTIMSFTLARHPSAKHVIRKNILKIVINEFRPAKHLKWQLNYSEDGPKPLITETKGDLMGVKALFLIDMLPHDGHPRRGHNHEYFMKVA